MSQWLIDLSWTELGNSLRSPAVFLVSWYKDDRHKETNGEPGADTGWQRSADWSQRLCLTLCLCLRDGEKPICYEMGFPHALCSHRVKAANLKWDLVIFQFSVQTRSSLWPQVSEPDKEIRSQGMERDSLRHPVQLIFTPTPTHQSLKHVDIQLSLQTV